MRSNGGSGGRSPTGGGTGGRAPPPYRPAAHQRPSRAATAPQTSAVRTTPIVRQRRATTASASDGPTRARRAKVAAAVGHSSLGATVMGKAPAIAIVTRMGGDDLSAPVRSTRARAALARATALAFAASPIACANPPQASSESASTLPWCIINCHASVTSGDGSTAPITNTVTETTTKTRGG